MRKFILFLVFLLLSVYNLYAASFNDDFGGIEDDALSFEKTKYDIGFAASGFFGMNDPGSGYQGYSTNPAGGGDFRILFKGRKGVKFFTSLGIDYFPLALPETQCELTENILVMYSNLTVNFLRWQKFIPFMGFGLGFYRDTLSQEVRNFGSFTASHTYFGFNGHVGLEVRITPYISIAPRYTRHVISEAGIYAGISVYSLNGIFYFGKRLEFEN
jgi:hypothetical protein